MVKFSVYLNRHVFVMDFPSNQSFSAHAWHLTKVACLILWLNFPLCLSLMRPNNIVSGEIVRMRSLVWTSDVCVWYNGSFSMVRLMSFFFNVNLDWLQSPATKYFFLIIQGPVVQNIVSLTTSLVVKMLTVQFTGIFAEKCEMQKLLTFFFRQKILAYMPYLMIKDITIR